MTPQAAHARAREPVTGKGRVGKGVFVLATGGCFAALGAVVTLYTYALAWMLWLPVTVVAVMATVRAFLLFATGETTADRLEHGLAATAGVLLFWVACASAAPLVRRHQLSEEVERFPLCRGCRIMSVDISVLAVDGHPGYTFEVHTARPDDALLLIRRQLAADGWRELRSVRPFQDVVQHRFTRPGRLLTMAIIEPQDRPQVIMVGCCVENLYYDCSPPPWEK